MAGHRCLNWRSETTYNLADSYVDHNYCRNFNLSDKNGPWCFETTGRFGYCLPHCETFEAYCLEKQELEKDSEHFRRTTISGQPCMPWKKALEIYEEETHNPTLDTRQLSDTDNRCRYLKHPLLPLGSRTNFSLGPFCYVANKYAFLEHCYAACNDLALRCFMPAAFEKYRERIYIGDRDTTISGLRCKPWHQLDRTYLKQYAFSSLCQCPFKEFERCKQYGLFCYTDHPDIKWEPCFVSCDSETTDRRNCVSPRTARRLYTGLRNFTYDGFACAPWLPSSEIPRKVLDEAKDAGAYGTNYCRNLDSDLQGPYCYVKDGEETVKKYCFPNCKEQAVKDNLDIACFDGIQGLDSYRGERNRDANNAVCRRWESVPPYTDKHNFCRNPTNFPRGPWCYRFDGSIGFCFKTCLHYQEESRYMEPTCLPDNDIMMWYAGRISKTIDDSPCARWDVMTATVDQSITAHSLGVRELSEVENFCRNPDLDTSGPWCFKPSGERQYCFFPCTHFLIRCLDVRQRQTIQYHGAKNTTVTGKVCSGNSRCRNSRFVKVLGPSCLVESGDKLIREPCFPLCEDFYESYDRRGLSTVYNSYMKRKALIQVERPADGGEVVSQEGFEGDVEAIRSTQRFGFWMFMFAIGMLLVSGMCFPLVRYMPLLKLFIISRRSKRHRDKGYLLVSSVFREHGRVPPSYNKYKKRRSELGPEKDPLLKLEQLHL